MDNIYNEEYVVVFVHLYVAYMYRNNTKKKSTSNIQCCVRVVAWLFKIVVCDKYIL